MIESVAAGKSGAGGDFPRGAPASARLRIAPPRGFRPLSLSGVPSRRRSRHVFQPGDVVQPAEDGSTDDPHPIR